MKSILILFLLFVLIACNSEKTEEKVSIPQKKDATIQESNSGIKKLLDYNFDQGNSFRYKLITELENSQHVESDSTVSSEVKQVAEYVFTLNVDKVTPNGISDVNVFIESIKSEATVNGETVNYDSKFLYSSRERMMFADYEAMKNNSYTVKVTKHGEILDIFDVDKIINEILSIQAGEKKISSEERASFTQQFINSGLSPLTEQLFRTTSKEKVGINSTWEQRYPSYVANFQIENIATFKVSDFQTTETDSLVKLDAGLSILWNGKNQIAEEGVKYTFSDPNITGFGEIYFNISKGVVQKSETTVRMELEVNMESMDSKQNVIKAYKKDFVMNKSKLELL